MNFLRYGKIYFLFSGTLIALSVIGFAVFRLQFGIDFTGGSIMEIEYQTQRPPNEEILSAISDLDLGSLYIQPTGERGVIIRMKAASEETHQRILERLEDAQELRFESTGPVIGRELQGKTRIIVLLSLLGIALYVMFAFRKTVRPLRSWSWSIVALFTLLHDTVITLGLLVILGKYYGVQIQIPILVALLTVIGYSINDTVVVFDRIRENLSHKAGFDLADTINKSITQTLSRSLATSATTLLVLLALLFFGGETLKFFALTLVAGIAIGTYSSIFIAPVLLFKWFGRRT